ncbi:MAG: hypothetical protein GY719_00535 [bacterium]|nr:hypothetical protein [bacterium]
MFSNKPRRLLPSAFLPLFLVTCPGAVFAQQDASFAGFQLNRSLPGARSLAMGGAFVALGDDATAAYSNPAGLTLLEASEVSIEARHWRTTTIYTESGDARGSNFPQLEGFEFGESTDESTGVSFLSFVYVPEAKKEEGKRRRWAIAIYRHELINSLASFESPERGGRRGVLKADPDETNRLFGPYSFTTDLQVTNFGAAASYRLGRGLRLGLGLSYYTFDLAAEQLVFGEPGETAMTGRPLGGITRDRGLKEGDDAKVAFNLGLQWEITPSWILGAAFRQGPTFEMRERFGLGPEPFFDQTNDFSIPDQYSIGVAFQPTSDLTISFEYDFVEYSSFLEGNRLSEPVNFASGPVSAAFELEDADEYRLGVEYEFALKQGNSVSLMAGAWHDPDHTIVWAGGPSQQESIRFRRAFFQPTGDDEIHYSFGTGVRAGRLQFEVAADFSDRIDTFAFSTVTTF